MGQRFKVIRGKRTAEPGQENESLELPAFEEALVAHLDHLFAFALRLVSGQRARAEDLVQEVCLRAFRRYAGLRDPEKIRTWLFQILVNAHINEYHRGSHEPPVVDVELSEALLDRAPTPEEDLFNHLLDDEVKQALDALPVEFRTVVWLSDVEELSYKEIAEVTGCPLGSVASRLYRGHSLLRERLREYARRRGLMKE